MSIGGKELRPIASYPGDLPYAARLCHNCAAPCGNRLALTSSRRGSPLDAMEVSTTAGWLRVRESTPAEVQQRATALVTDALRRQAEQHLGSSEQPGITPPGLSLNCSGLPFRRTESGSRSPVPHRQRPQLHQRRPLPAPMTLSRGPVAFRKPREPRRRRYAQIPPAPRAGSLHSVGPGPGFFHSASAPQQCVAGAMSAAFVKRSLPAPRNVHDRPPPS
jgi:hypothetical protein